MADTIMLDASLHNAYSRDWMRGGMYSVIVAQVVAAFLLLEQTIPDVGLSTQIERLGLTASLIVAVGILWKTVTKKDVQIEELSKQVVNALVVNTEMTRHMIDELSRLPCRNGGKPPCD